MLAETSPSPSRSRAEPANPKPSPENSMFSIREPPSSGIDVEAHRRRHADALRPAEARDDQSRPLEVEVVVLALAAFEAAHLCVDGAGDDVLDVEAELQARCRDRARVMPPAGRLELRRHSR